jgi:tetratricopeptide (TPR) repeat protein
LVRRHRKSESRRRPSLSLCMIVRNEAQNLEACVSPLRSLLDEIVLVDTGSSDDTREVGQALGASVFEFPWNDDFSAARNESIRHAHGDYILWLDADDRVDGSEIEKLLALKKALPPRKTHAYYLTINNQSVVDGETLFHQLRLFPNIPGARFQGRIHEQVYYTLRQKGISFVYTDIVIRHTGYHDTASVIRKSERNLAILLKELDDDPQNPILHYHAGRTLSGIGRYEEAIFHMKKVTEDPKIQKEEKRFFLEASLLLGKYCVEAKRLEEAASVFQGLQRQFPHEGLVHFGLGETLFLLNDFEGARRALEASLSYPFKVGLFPVNLQRLRYYQYYLLARSYLETGQREKAAQTFLKSLHQHPDDYKSLQALGLMCLEEGRLEEAISYYERAVQRGAASPENLSTLGVLYKKLRRWDEAEQIFLRLHDLAPEAMEPLLQLGELYRSKKDYEKALSFFLASLKQDSHRPEVRLALSDLCFRLEKIEELVEHCDALLQHLALPRDMVLSTVEELSALYEQVAERLFEKGEEKLSLEAWKVAFFISPSQRILEKMISMAPSTEEMKNLVNELMEGLRSRGVEREGKPLLPPGFSEKKEGDSPRPLSFSSRGPINR